MKSRIVIATVVIGVIGIAVHVLRLPQADTRLIARQQKTGKSNSDSRLVDSALS